MTYKESLISPEETKFLAHWLPRHYGPPQYDCCQKCGGPLLDGYCRDETCPYSDWPQVIPLEEMYELSTKTLEARYRITKKS